MGIKVDYQKLPSNSFEAIQEGLYILEIEDVIESNDATYGSRIILSHKIVNTPAKINFDSYRISNVDGTPNEWGRGKLKVLIDALELQDVEDITVPLLKQLAVKKRIKANIKLNAKNYPNINYADIYSINDEREAINEVPRVDAKPEKITTKVRNSVSEEIKEEVDNINKTIANDNDDI